MMKRLFLTFLTLILVVGLTAPVWAQCSSSPTPTASLTPTSTPSPTPSATPTPYAGNWLKVSFGSAWLPNINNQMGVYGSYFLTLNQAPFDVTFTYAFTGNNPTAFTAVFPNNAVCITNPDGSITVKAGRGCPWWIETSEFGVDAFYVATTMGADPGSPYTEQAWH